MSQPTAIDQGAAEGIRAALLGWFAANARDLPWRRTRDPYRILVSEIMLQQTQVERVIPKYEAFLAAFPTLAALAEAPTAEVIRLWAGLGYNRRAVNLQRAARAVLEEHGGVFPSSPEALAALPGVGPYTAGAVACFAFERDVAFMDTNIRRVLRRLWAGPDETAAASDRELLAVGAALVPPGQGWAWNQAIMELGALVCTAGAPACWRCPLRDPCRAYAEGRAAAGGLFAEDAALAAYRPAPPPRRRAAEAREEPYLGSRRYFRGRLVDALRELPPGAFAPLAELGPRVKAGFAEADGDWLATLAADLARDGLIELGEAGARLPQ